MSERVIDDVLELPFDQYQRYRVATDLAEVLGVQTGMTILDVGGGPGFVEAFLPECPAIVVDVEGKRGGRFVLANGARLPFPDRSFPIAFTLDTLEHVPLEVRPAFLDELRRVADTVVLSAPFADPAIVLAEEALLNFVNERFGGDFPTLEEHTERGLPELEVTLEQLGEGDWEIASLPSGYLPRWLAGMLVYHELLASGVPNLPRLHAFYNATVSPLDTRAPSYRQVLVASRTHSRDQLVAATESLRADGDTDEGNAALRAMASAVLAHRVGNAFSAQASGGPEAATLRTEIARMHEEIVRRDGQITELHEERERILRELSEANRIARRSLSGAVMQRAADWRASRRS